MRLEYVISAMGVGGAERVVVDLLEDAVRRNDELGLLADPGSLDALIADLGILRAPLPTERSPAAVLSGAIAAARFARRFAPELVHAHNVRVTGLARFGIQLARPGRRPPLLSTFHGVPPAEAGNAAWVLRLADHVVCVSDGLRDQLEQSGMPPERLSVIPNGVPEARPLTAERRRQLDAELNLTEEAPVVAIVGRLVAQKAHERFLRAASLVARRVPDTLFLVVGDGPRRSELETLASDLELESRTRFTGLRDDARDLIARSSMVVFSSIWEGLSIVALEALAAGVPVVSTEVAGTSEILSDGAGLITPHDDSALADAIIDLLSKPAKQKKMGERGRQLHQERFSTTRMAQSYRELYALLLDR